MANRIARYARDIRKSFRWEDIRSEAYREGYCLLGSVLRLTPSGKFYMPWACSNVMGCRGCGGKGSVRNGKANAAEYARLDAAARELLHHLWATENMAVNWSPESKARMAALRAERDQYVDTLTCSWCRGLGSHEAAMDEDWHEALARVAKEFGLFVGGPEGADGEDVWLCDPDSPVIAEEDARIEATYMAEQAEF